MLIDKKMVKAIVRNSGFSTSLISLAVVLSLTMIKRSSGHAHPEAQDSPPPPDKYVLKSGVAELLRDQRLKPPSQLETRAPATLAINDQFGYIVDDAVPYSWLSATSGTMLTLPGEDDSFAGPVSDLISNSMNIRTINCSSARTAS